MTTFFDYTKTFFEVEGLDFVHDNFRHDRIPEVPEKPEVQV